MTEVPVEKKPPSGVQEDLVPERVVDGLPTMYCFETCPFCFKVKALLGSRGIEYSKVEVDPTFKTQLKWSDWGMVPVFVDVDGTTSMPMTRDRSREWVRTPSRTGG